MSECGRCGNTDVRELGLRLVDLAREHREDGLTHLGPDYANDIRCRDREACRQRARLLGLTDDPSAARAYEGNR